MRDTPTGVPTSQSQEGEICNHENVEKEQRYDVRRTETICLIPPLWSLDDSHKSIDKRHALRVFSCD
jgi:hypothetical protein